jgi:hypothetical protein
MEDRLQIVSIPQCLRVQREKMGKTNRFFPNSDVEMPSDINAYCQKSIPAAVYRFG